MAHSRSAARPAVLQEKPPRPPTISAKGNTRYKRPQHGIFPYLPDSWVPYAEVMRLDRQAGFWAFYWHYLIGLGFALNVSIQSNHAMNVSPMAAAALIFYLYIFTTLHRGLVCAWNDILDQDVDRQVARTRNRPIARGALSTRNGLIFTAFQAVLNVAMLVRAPVAAGVHDTIITVLLFIYPLLKRCTDFPQLLLGVGVSYNIFFVCALLGHEQLAPLWAARGDPALAWQFIQSMPYLQASLCLYVAGFLWTVIYDTIYAHQDFFDDSKAGVRSLAIRLGRRGTKPGLGVLAAVQVACLVAAGRAAGFGPVYHVIACGGVAASLLVMFWQVQLEVPESCAWWFGHGSRPVGACLVAGLFVEYLMKYWAWS